MCARRCTMYCVSSFCCACAWVYSLCDSAEGLDMMGCVFLSICSKSNFVWLCGLVVWFGALILMYIKVDLTHSCFFCRSCCRWPIAEGNSTPRVEGPGARHELWDACSYMDREAGSPLTKSLPSPSAAGSAYRWDIQTSTNQAAYFLSG